MRRAEAFGVAESRGRGDFLAAFRRRVGDQRVDQLARDDRDAVDRAVERVLVRLRRLGGPAQLPHELQRRGANLLVGRRRIEVEQLLDVSAHIVVRSYELKAAARGRTRRPARGPSLRSYSYAMGAQLEADLDQAHESRTDGSGGAGDAGRRPRHPRQRESGRQAPGHHPVARTLADGDRRPRRRRAADRAPREPARVGRRPRTHPRPHPPHRLPAASGCSARRARANAWTRPTKACAPRSIPTGAAAPSARSSMTAKSPSATPSRGKRFTSRNLSQPRSPMPANRGRGANRAASLQRRASAGGLNTSARSACDHPCRAESRHPIRPEHLPSARRVSRERGRRGMTVPVATPGADDGDARLQRIEKCRGARRPAPMMRHLQYPQRHRH